MKLKLVQKAEVVRATGDRARLEGCYIVTILAEYTITAIAH